VWIAERGILGITGLHCGHGIGDKVVCERGRVLSP
jgi:hypothetical protein